MSRWKIGKAPLMLALGAWGLRAAAITYQVDQTVGAGSVTGFIETDGTMGTLSGTNLLDWNLLLNNGTTTFDLLGPLSGSNSMFVGGGADLSATATQLLFNFTNTDHGVAAFAVGGGPADFWCSGLDACEVGTPGESLAIGLPAQYTELSGTQVIASVAPEPSTLGFLSLGVATLTGSRFLLTRKRAS